MSIKHRTRLSVLGAVTVAGALSLATPGAIARPAFSGPSVVQAGQTVFFRGSGFKPNEALTVAVTSPEGSEAHFATVADAKGALYYKVAPRGAGFHALRVLDSGGRLVSETRFHTP
jgi:hypothetical protein